MTPEHCNTLHTLLSRGAPEEITPSLASAGTPQCAPRIRLKRLNQHPEYRITPHVNLKKGAIPLPRLSLARQHIPNDQLAFTAPPHDSNVD